MARILETQRLRLRELLFTDASFIVELVNSPGWLTFIGDRNIRTDEQARIYLETGPLRSYAEKGYGLSLVETKSNDSPIGLCGVLKRETLDNPDLGFAFLPRYQGQGFAAEITTATVAYAHNNWGLLTLDAITREDNFRAIRLLERTGFIYQRKLSLPHSLEELCLYRK